MLFLPNVGSPTEPVCRPKPNPRPRNLANARRSERVLHQRIELERRRRADRRETIAIGREEGLADAVAVERPHRLASGQVEAQRDPLLEVVAEADAEHL